MLARKTVYHFMSVERLSERSMRDIEKLNVEKDTKKKSKILEDVFDIMHEMIRKNRYNEEFMKEAQKRITEEIFKCNAAKEGLN